MNTSVYPVRFALSGSRDALAAGLRFLVTTLAALGTVSSLSAKTRFSTTFDSGDPWSQEYRQVSSNITNPTSGTLLGIGTYNPSNRQARSTAFRLAFTTPASGAWNAAVRTNRFSVTPSTYANQYLNLSFDLWTTSAAPVKIAIYTYPDTTSVATGKMVTTVYPPVAGAFYRQSIDLDQMTTEWGSPNPRLGVIELGFEIASPASGAPGWPLNTASSLYVDNVSFTEPRYFVKPDATGNDGGPGTQSQPFRSIKRAIDLAQPGDVICLLTGTYLPVVDSGDDDVDNCVVFIKKSGEPDRWITLRAAPGASPLLSVPQSYTSTWAAMTIARPASYIEVRDLIVRGFRPSTTTEFNNILAEAEANVTGGTTFDADGFPILPPVQARFNVNGIYVNGRTSGITSSTPLADRIAAENAGAHHVRIINNDVGNFPGGGISANHVDHFTAVGNTVFNTSFYTRYGTSGISTLHPYNFDPGTETKHFILGNRSFGNRSYVTYAVTYRGSKGARKVLSDGNGMIADVNNEGEYVRDSANQGDYSFKGRALIANNVLYGNGGAGIAITKADHIDIVNNTLYRNVQSPRQQIDYSNAAFPNQFKFYDLQVTGEDVRVRNNVVWSDKSAGVLDVNSSDFTFTNNLYYGASGSFPAPLPVTGTNESWLLRTSDTEPLQFTAPSLAATASFTLQAGSPAIGTAARGSSRGVPLIDIDGNLRPANNLDRGAHERP